MISLLRFGLAVALVVLAGTPASAGAGEPGLVVEKLSDPDPGFVPPPPEKPRARAQRRPAKDPTLDEAFENLGRVAGQAAQMAEQRERADRQKLIQLACKAIDDARAGGMDVSRWEKDC